MIYAEKSDVEGVSSGVVAEPKKLERLRANAERFRKEATLGATRIPSGTAHKFYLKNRPSRQALRLFNCEKRRSPSTKLNLSIINFIIFLMATFQKIRVVLV